MDFEEAMKNYKRTAQQEKDQISIEKLERKVDKLTKELNAYGIDIQLYIAANPPIIPGIATKIAYDKNGLVLKGMQLDATDIPELPISHISGLQTALNNIPDMVDIKKLTSEMKSSIIRRSNESVGTATKVNYDANGFIVSTSPLLPDDIPSLPMDKIDGLTDIIDIIKSLTDNPVRTSLVDNPVITHAGTYTKVSVDSYGRVISGEKLNIHDLPADLINRMNQIESSMVNCASSEQLDKISKRLLDKVDSNSPIRPGTYTKVSVDDKGLVVSGGNLTISDLPLLTIDCIDGLTRELNQTAKYTDIADLNDSISQLIGSTPSMSDVNQLKMSVKLKAEADDVCRLEKEIEKIQDDLQAVVEHIPVELIQERFRFFEDSIHNISDRLASIEDMIKEMKK